MNVVRTDRDSETNVLADIIRGWFGPEAGRPGTRHQVAFESGGDTLKLEPVGVSKSKSENNWRHFMGEDIPPLFGLMFSPGNWNQGFVTAEGHLFLLVTLEKGSLSTEHSYEDHFLSSERFHWQSQNRTKQDSKHGRMIRDHQAEGVDVHLFIRKKKTLSGKAAPFVYCGLVDFESWKGEKPISVEWRLRDPVPTTMRETLNVHDHD